MRLRSIGLLVTLALGLLLSPLAAEAQPAGKVARIGYLGVSSPSSAAHLVEALQQGLRDLGYVEGQNITLEYRSAEGREDQLSVLAAELVRLKVDIIVTAGPPNGVESAKWPCIPVPKQFIMRADGRIT